MNYVPQPIDTSKIELADEIEDLTEYLAFHAHEVWARQRLLDGWKLGDVRNDEKKEHPCLIPYDDLTETEKQYDRNAALETLKVILANGYRILPPPSGRKATRASEAVAVANAHSLLAQMRAAEKSSSGPSGRPRLGEIATLLQVWNSRNEEDRAWKCEPELYRHLARRFLKLGEAPLAREVAETALAQKEGESHLWEHDLELRQILGLSLARSGSPHRAQTLLKELADDGCDDEETLGLLARTYKDEAIECPAADENRVVLLERALKHYKHAYKISGGFWTGINVATLERLLNHDADAIATAERVRQECLADLQTKQSEGASPAQTYWHLATLGEAALVLGDLQEAGEQYSSAYEAASNRFGDLNTTRRHTRWLLGHWESLGKSEAELELLDRWMPIPQVVVFCGHMVDRDGRTATRFPEKLSDSVRRSIEQWVNEHNGLIGFSSAACGADLLFQQVIQERGGESRIVLPYDIGQFKLDGVDYAGNHWSELFDDVIANATKLIIASPKRVQRDGISFDYANLIMHGLATVRATELQSNDGTPVGLTVWNGAEGDGLGGTASCIRNWSELDMDVHQIDLSKPEVPAEGLFPVIKNPKVPETARRVRKRDQTADTRIMSMLFGDAVNFSGLDESQVSRFIQHFMSPIAEIVRTYGDANVVRNTWGDGLYLVFDDVIVAGKCALDICDFTNRQVAEGRWQDHRLPKDLNVRIALHAGPVFGCIDPITGLQNYSGTHVSRAARLEPKTPPGEVYASEAFAALCAKYSDEEMEFSCQYVKQLSWAKHYGSFPTFVLRRLSKKPDSKSKSVGQKSETGSGEGGES